MVGTLSDEEELVKNSTNVVDRILCVVLTMYSNARRPRPEFSALTTLLRHVMEWLFSVFIDRILGLM